MALNFGTLKALRGTYAAPGDDDGNARLGGDAEGINGQIVLVDVMLLLEDVVKVPHLSRTMNYV